VTETTLCPTVTSPRDEKWTSVSPLYADNPYYRLLGHVSEAVGGVMSAEHMAEDDPPSDVLISVVHWLHKGGVQCS